METSSVFSVSQAAWEKIRRKVKHSVVFLDSKIAEILHWSGGGATLFEAGADDVREFSSFENGKESRKKGVFVIGSPLIDVAKQIVEDIIRQSHFQYVVIITTACPLLHSGNTDREDEADDSFEEMEDLVLEWMGNMNYTAEVCHIPLFGCDICPGFFITPAFSSMFPLLSSDLRQVSYQHSTSSKSKDTRPLESLHDVEFSHLPDGLQLQIRLLASGMDSLLQGLDVKEDIYFMGDTSRIIATELDSYPPGKTRRKTAQTKTSLLLIDRTLDTASAVSHQFDSLLDRIINTLPHLPGHTCDHLIDMSDICLAYSKNEDCSRLVPPGSLASSNTKSSREHLLPLIMKKQKEALMVVNRNLIETASAAKLPLDLSKKPSRITPELLDSTISLFKGKYSLIAQHLDVLQVAMATSQTLKDPVGRQYDSLIAKEKNVVQTIADVEEEGMDDSRQGPSPLSVLSKILLQEMEKEPEERELTLDGFLSLLTYYYAVSDGSLDDEDEAKMMQEHLVQAILKDKENLPPLVQKIVGDKVNESILPDQVDSLWEKLESLSQGREGMTQFNSVLDHGDAMTPASIKPLLRQVMERIVNPSKPDLPDVTCKSGGLKDLLKSGFGLFKSTAKPRPGDGPLLIVFVIGGVTTTEVKQVKDIVAKAKPDFDVIIGSTRLSSIENSLHSVFVSDNINIE